MSRRSWHRLYALGALVALFSACDSGGIVGGSCKKGAACDGRGGTSAGGNAGSTAEDAGGEIGEAGRNSPDFVDRPGTRGGNSGHDGAGAGGAAGEAGEGMSGSNGTGASGGATGAGARSGSNGVGGSGEEIQCEDPLVACGGECVDTNVNPLHCGRCFNACPSGICQAGECVGATTGHVAAYCMNFAAASAQSTHAVLLANAVFLPIRAEVRILALTSWAPARVRSRITDLLRASASTRGRSFALTELDDPSKLSAELNIQNYDVFLIYEQSTAPAGELAALGADWQKSLVLESFARAGGVIIALDGAQGSGEMPEFLAASGLLEVNGHTAIAEDDGTTRFYNRAPADALAVNVVSPFSPVSNSCTFESALTPSSETVFVVTDAPSPAAGDPVAVHRIVVPTSP